MGFQDEVTESLNTAKEKAVAEIARLIEDIGNFEAKVTEIKANLKELSGEEEKESTTLNELNRRIGKLTKELADSHSTINNIMKLRKFLLTLSKRVEKEEINLEVFDGFLAKAQSEYPEAEALEKQFEETCAELHRIIRAKITIEQKITGNVARAIQTIDGMNKRLKAIA